VTAQIEALQPAPTARPDDPQKLVEELPHKIAPKLQQPIQSVVKVADQSAEERLAKIEAKFASSDREESGGLRAYVVAAIGGFGDICSAFQLDPPDRGCEARAPAHSP
jgi:hypothetical protein